MCFGCFDAVLTGEGQASKSHGPVYFQVAFLWLDIRAGIGTGNTNVESLPEVCNGGCWACLRNSFFVMRVPLDNLSCAVMVFLLAFKWSARSVSAY